MESTANSLRKFVHTFSYPVLLAGLAVFSILAFSTGAETRQIQQVEWHDIVAEIFIACVILSWMSIARRMAADSQTYLYFYAGSASVIWLMGIKFFAEWLVNPTPILAIFELMFSISGLLLLTAGLISWSKDYQVLIDQLDSNVTRFRMMSERDSLTGLFNRSQFESTLNHLLEQEAPFSLLLIDLDHFKQVNDNYGHPVGDTVIEHTAKILQRNLRKEDYAFRLGGEEFALLLPEVSMDLAQRLATERLTAIRSNTFVTHDGMGFNVTTSIGIGQREPGDTASTLYRRTDAALYQAKEKGRNQVAIYQGESEHDI